MTDPDTLLTVREVAEMTKFDESFIYRQIQAGRLECTKLSPKAFRVRRSAVQAWVDRATVPVSTDA